MRIVCCHLDHDAVMRSGRPFVGAIGGFALLPQPLASCLHHKLAAQCNGWQSRTRLASVGAVASLQLEHDVRKALEGWDLMLKTQQNRIFNQWFWPVDASCNGVEPLGFL